MAPHAWWVTFPLTVLSRDRTVANLFPQISYLSSSQGFAWNPELFLPSYVDFEYTPLEHRRDQVVEIFLSDEDIKRILPQ